MQLFLKVNYLVTLETPGIKVIEWSRFLSLMMTVISETEPIDLRKVLMVDTSLKKQRWKLNKLFFTTFTLFFLFVRIWN